MSNFRFSIFRQYYYERDRARPGAAYPPYEIGGGSGGAGGYRPMGMGYDNSINSNTGDGFGGLGPVRPITSRCDDENGFKQIGTRQRVRRQYVRRILPAQSLLHCQRECIEAKDFVCRSFNYRDTALLYDNDNAGTSREREVTNCELSDRDTRELDLQNPTMFDTGSFDYYERSNARSSADATDCLDGSYMATAPSHWGLNSQFSFRFQCRKRATKTVWNSRYEHQRDSTGASTHMAFTIAAFSVAAAAR